MHKANLAIAALSAVSLGLVGPASGANGSEAKPEDSQRRNESLQSTAAPSLFDPNANRIETTDAADVKPSVATQKEIDQAVSDYWTPSNMRAAIANSQVESMTRKHIVIIARSMHLLKPNPLNSGDFSSHERGWSVPPAAPTVKDNSRAASYKNKTIGKLFFTLPNGASSSCSAAVTNSSSGRLITTAGHCVHAGDGDPNHWMSNGYFVPGYQNGDRPYGSFRVRWWRTFDWFREYGPYDPRGLLRDVAYATLENGDGSPKKKVVNSVGGQGSIFKKAGSWAWKARVVGYPENHNGGEGVSSCSKRTYQAETDPYTRQQIDCQWNQGSSGGPWIWKSDPETGLGRIRSVTSTTEGTKHRFIQGPPFDKEVRGMYRCANDDWPDGAGHCG